MQRRSILMRHETGRMETYYTRESSATPRRVATARPLLSVEEKPVLRGLRRWIGLRPIEQGGGPRARARTRGGPRARARARARARTRGGLRARARPGRRGRAGARDRAGDLARDRARRGRRDRRRRLAGRRARGRARLEARHVRGAELQVLVRLAPQPLVFVARHGGDAPLGDDVPVDAALGHEGGVGVVEEGLHLVRRLERRAPSDGGDKRGGPELALGAAPPGGGPRARAPLERAPRRVVPRGGPPPRSGRGRGTSPP